MNLRKLKTIDDNWNFVLRGLFLFYKVYRLFALASRFNYSHFSSDTCMYNLENRTILSDQSFRLHCTMGRERFWRAIGVVRLRLLRYLSISRYSFNKMDVWQIVSRLLDRLWSSISGFGHGVRRLLILVSWTWFWFYSSS